MARPRTLDPSNLPNFPNPTTDPEREKDLLSELNNRLHYLTKSYFASQQILESGDTFNESLERLRRGLKRKRILKRRGIRLHPYLELLVSYHARQRAALEDGEGNESHVREAAQHVVALTKPLRGRPKNPMLIYHIEGLVALIHQFSGKPVLSQRYKDSVYEPGFPDGVSQIVPIIARTWDKNITETQLVHIVQNIRKKYAGKPLRFIDLFPAYGVSLTDTKNEEQSQTSIEIKNLNIPIYCP